MASTNLVVRVTTCSILAALIVVSWFFTVGHTNPEREILSPIVEADIFEPGSLRFVGRGGTENFELALHGSTLKIDINSTRRRCGMNATGPSEACVFRVYVSSDSFRSGDYCSAIKFSNGSYQCSLDVIENHFKILLLIESFANNSDFGLFDSPSWGAITFNDTHLSAGEALLEQEVQLGSKQIFVPLTKHPRLCSYREADVAGNNFIWVSKGLVEAAGLSKTDALLAPGNKDRELPLAQNYVWFPRGCHQPWVLREELEEAGEAVGGMDVVFIGSSRIRGSHRAFLSMYNFTSEAARVFYCDMKIWVPHQVWVIMGNIVREPPWPQLCPANFTANPRLLVLVLSEGMWSARGHENFGAVKDLGIFRYYDHFLVMLDIFRNLCRFRRVKVVLATQPQTQSWDCRVSSERNMLPREAKLALFGPRIQVVNWAIRKVAREQGLLLADLGGASDARRDASCDNLHYDHTSSQNSSQGVTLTFLQLMLAATLEAAKQP